MASIKKMKETTNSHTVKSAVNKVVKELLSDAELKQKVKNHKLTWFGQMLLDSGAADLIQKQWKKKRTS